MVKEGNSRIFKLSLTNYERRAWFLGSWDWDKASPFAMSASFSPWISIDPYYLIWIY